MTTGKGEYYNGENWIAVGTVLNVTAGNGLNGGTITESGTISLPDIGVAGTYSYPSSIVTDEHGRLVTVTEGSAPLSKVSGTVNEISVSGTSDIIIAIADNPVLPGNVTVDSTGFLTLPVGNTSQRPANAAIGMLRINTDLV